MSTDGVIPVVKLCDMGLGRIKTMQTMLSTGDGAEPGTPMYQAPRWTQVSSESRARAGGQVLESRDRAGGQVSESRARAEGQE